MSGIPTDDGLRKVSLTWNEVLALFFLVSSPAGLSEMKSATYARWSMRSGHELKRALT